MALRGKPARLAALVAGALGAACIVVALIATRGDERHPARGRIGAAIGSEPGGQVRDTEAAQSFPEPDSGAPRQLAEDPASAAASSAADTGPSPGAPSDAEVRRDLRRLQRYQRRARAGGRLGLTGRGRAEAPPGSPGAIQDIVAGGNAIATFPYRLGGGHGSFVDDAYDCSGSVSYALAAAGLLDVPLTSGDLATWGVDGPGRWLTIYANPGHVFMTVGGIRFDTSGRDGRRGSRWQPLGRSAGGFVVRHWPGL